MPGNSRKGDTIINQGKDGNDLYIVAKGHLNCFKKFKASDLPQYLHTYGPGESFGE